MVLVTMPWQQQNITHDCMHVATYYFLIIIRMLVASLSTLATRTHSSSNLLVASQTHDELSQLPNIGTEL